MNNKFFIASLSLLLSTTTTFAEITLEQQQALAEFNALHRPSLFGDVKKYVCDFMLEWKGMKNLSLENQAFARSIQKKLGMLSTKVTFKNMSAQQRAHLGLLALKQSNNPAMSRYNSIISLYASLRLTHRLFKKGAENNIILDLTANRMFINEAWFNTLSESEKTFALSTMLQHIKKHHFSKRILLGLLSGPLYPLTRGLRNRYFERAADEAACRELPGAAQGGLSLIKKAKLYKQDPHSQFMIKRIIRTLTKPFKWFGRFVTSEHNSLKSRYFRLATLSALPNDQRPS